MKMGTIGAVLIARRSGTPLVAPELLKGREDDADNRRDQQKIGSRSVDTLFNKRDYQAAERLWSPHYIQHSAHIKPGRDGLFELIRSSPATLRYEPGTIVADGDYVIVHGRFTNTGRPRNWIAADVVRVADGLLAEHWDVLQDEATEAESQSGLPMFGTKFPTARKD